MEQAYIFDLDDTLYEEESYVRAAFRHTAEYAAERVGRPKLAEELYQRMMALLAEQGRGRILNRVCEEYGLRIKPAELIEVYRDTKPALSLYPDAEETLQALRARGIKTGLITDGLAKVQHSKAKALGLDERMDFLLMTDDIGTKKPDEKVYKTCLSALGVDAKEAIYIGDNPEKDFIGARALGMKTARIVRPLGMCVGKVEGPEKEADVTIFSLTELLEDKE